MVCVREKICQTLFPCCIYSRNRHLTRPACWNSPTCKEFVGFLGGMILTLLLYLVLVFHQNAPPWLAFTSCAWLGLGLTLTMAFSANIRCLVLLMLPQFFSSKGRMLLLVYALFLAMNQPLNNVRVNVGVMAQSATCGQEMAINGTKALVKAAVAPMQSVMDSIKEVLQKLVDFANMMKRTYNILKQTVKEIGAIIRRVGQWLANMVDRCNDNMGAPYRKCQQAFDTAVQNCRDDLGPTKFLCELAGGFDFLCNIVRVGELLCLIVDVIKNLIESIVDIPVQRVLSSAKEMFYFNVSIKYHFNYTMTQSKNYSDIAKNIQKEIMSRLDGFLRFTQILRNVLVITLGFIIIKALIYRTRWLSSDRYDNLYITFTVRDLDERRKENNKSGILPLLYDETKKYIESESLFMTYKEMRKLAFGFVMFMISAFNAGFYLFCDFGLYFALHLIEVSFGMLTTPPIPPHTKMVVAGRGPMADLYRSVVSMFDPLSRAVKDAVDVASCVPRPSVPDWGIYKVIGLIYFVCFILTITEAYGLRLRHQIMGCYFPRREKKRAIWLFNHILKTRGGAIENARIKAKKRKKGEIDTVHISIKGRLAASFPICEKILKSLGWDVKSCLYCGREGKPDDYVNFVHCSFFDCDAIYCVDCYADLENICAVCDNAIEMKGEDGSEEEDSSEDERTKLLKLAQKKARGEKVARLQLARRPSKVLAKLREDFGGVGKEMDLSENAVIRRNWNNSAINVRQKVLTGSWKQNQSTHSSWQGSTHWYSDSGDWESYNQQQCSPTATDIYKPEYKCCGKPPRDLVYSAGSTICESQCDVFMRDCQAESLTSAEDISVSTYDDTDDQSVAVSEIGYHDDSSTSEDEGVSSASSVDSDDLDFDYQYQKTLQEKPKYREKKKNPARWSVELVTEDIFSETESESEDKNESLNMLHEPRCMSMWRE